MSAPISIELRSEGDTRVLVLVGEVDVASVADVSHAGLSAVQNAGEAALVVDLAGVPFVDSSALSALVLIANAAAAAGVTFSLRNAQRQARRVISLMGLDEKMGVVSPQIEITDRQPLNHRRSRSIE